MTSTFVATTMLVLALALTTVSQSKPHFHETVETISNNKWETSASNGTHIHHKNSDGVDEVLTIQEYNEKYPMSKQDTLVLENAQRKAQAELVDAESHVSEMMAKTQKSIFDMNRQMQETFRREFGNGMFPFGRGRF